MPVDSCTLEQMEQHPIHALLTTWHEGWDTLDWVERYAIMKGLTKGQFKEAEWLATEHELTIG